MPAEVNRMLRRFGAALIIVGLLPGLAARGEVAGLANLSVAVEGLRSTKGLVQLCVTASPKHFPDCSGDPAARRLTVPATEAARQSFTGLPPGTYAVALIHDENGNGKLDTRMGVPVEGFGFSRNPRIMFGPPGFKAAGFALTPAQAGEQRVRVKYMF